MEEDGGSGIKDPPPAGTNPDAAVIEPRPDASPGGDGDGGPVDGGCAVQTIDLFENGDFDSGAGVGWAESSTGGFDLVVAEADIPAALDVVADSGTFLAFLGGYDSATDEIHQGVTVPDDAGDIRLRGVGRIDSAEILEDIPFDIAFLEIQSETGEVLEELARFSNVEETGGRYGDFERRANGDYRGQTVRFQLRVTTDASRRTHFFFDTLVLEVGTCSGGAGLLP
jgi:hypothetical protein